MDGKIVSLYSAYDFALGIKSVMWSPSSQFLVIGSYDQSVSNFHCSSHTCTLCFLLFSEVKIYEDDFKWSRINNFDIK